MAINSDISWEGKVIVHLKLQKSLNLVLRVTWISLVTLVIVNPIKPWFGVMTELYLIAAADQVSDRRNDEE